MRIEQVVAESFGPFRGEQLVLAPGMTVVHGPNEAGKSSWFAATYAGLGGRRRQRGRGTREQADFKRRHKPWRRGAWRVGVIIELDNGRRLRLAHDLGTGNSVVEDLDTGRSLATGRLEHDGGVDGTTLLGLNRDSARATIFVAQADILRVLEEADALQEYLQRAAASTTVDTTVEEALTWIAERRRTEVGAAHITGRPLGVATAALERARGAADAARDEHDRLQLLLVQQAEARADLATAEEWLELLRTANRWRRLDQMTSRLERAEQLARQLDAGSDGPAPADDDLVRRATVVLAAFRDRGAPPAPPGRPDVEELKAQLDSLPAVPDGDCRPHADVIAALEAHRDARSTLDAHHRAKPQAGNQDLPDIDPDELRQHALALSEERPAVDPSDLEALERRRAAAAEARAAHKLRVEDHAQAVTAYEAAEAAQRQAMEAYREALGEYERELDETPVVQISPVQPPSEGGAGDRGQRPRMPLLVIGGILLLAAAGVAAISPPAAAALGVAGVLVGIAAVVMGRTRDAAGSPQLPTAAPPAPSRTAPRPTLPEPHGVPAPGPAPVPPPPDPEIGRLEARVEGVQAAQAVHDERQEQLRQFLREHGLPLEPADLRELARQLDDKNSATRALEEWDTRTPQLEDEVRNTGEALRQVVSTRDPSLASEVGSIAPLEAWARYEEECAARARAAAESARRDDLAAALEQRRQADERFAEAHERYTQAGVELQALAEELGLDGDADVALDEWLDAQAAFRKDREQRSAMAARLEQILDGQTVIDLREAVAAEHATIPARPDFAPEDLDTQSDRWTRRRDAAAQRVSELTGQIDSLSSNMPSVAAAMEAEADAERQLSVVQDHAEVLDLVHAGLVEAKDRVNADIAPALAAKLRPWVPRVTGGRYTDVQVDPSTLEIQVLEPGGGYRDATVLSHGTTEQIYLLLRLALAELLADADERAPLVLDDVTVQSDRERTWAVLDLLHELSQDRQIILFTQEEEVVEWARTRLGDEDCLHGLAL